VPDTEFVPKASRKGAKVLKDAKGILKGERISKKSNPYLLFAS
jgi:hypothetical protein